MDKLTIFIGLLLYQCEKGTSLCKTKYYKELIQKFGMENSKAFHTPMGSTCSLEKDDQGNTADETKYWGMIGSLLYLISSQPNIIISVCKCAPFQSSPKESHLMVVKHIIHYIVVTTLLVYGIQKIFFLEGFSDADYKGEKDDKKRTSCTCQILVKFLISRDNKK